MSKKSSAVPVFHMTASQMADYHRLLIIAPLAAADRLKALQSKFALKLARSASKNSVIVTPNLELPGIPPIPKKRGRPISLTSKSNAERQRDFRIAFKDKVTRAINSHASLVSSSSAVLVATLADAVRLAGSDSVFSFDISTILDELKKRYSNA